MSDPVKVDISTDNAILLLAAAEEMGLPPEVVQTRGGKFEVPSEVNDKAFGHKTDEVKKPAAKKTTAAKKPQE